MFYICYLGPNPIKPAQTLTWSWEEAYRQYGYAACTVESFFQLRNACIQPDNYSQEYVDQISSQGIALHSASASATPDIVLILNETFYDLRQITDPDTDVPYLAHMESMENLLWGYAVATNSGGGTNNSEYELLTSNSLQLMPGVTPFNTINLTDANNIASHLHALGYDTLATHPEPALNYSRSMAYPTLGFDTCYFMDDYQDLTYYQNRWFDTDESVYQNLFRWYEEAPENVPRFQYLLTIQNHGAWDTNSPEHDFVHTQRDYGENTQLVNEFLSCIYLSDLAFLTLTEYYSAVDRPVIVCMVGDHSPNFAEDIADPDFSEEELSLRLRSVPFVIWANYPLEKQELGTISMNMVVPTLLEIADVSLSPYYRYMLQLKEQVPILTSYGTYYDCDGNSYQYATDDATPYAEAVDDYFFLEYQNIATKDNRDFYS